LLHQLSNETLLKFAWVGVSELGTDRLFSLPHWVLCVVLYLLGALDELGQSVEQEGNDRVARVLLNGGHERFVGLSVHVVHLLVALVTQVLFDLLEVLDLLFELIVLGLESILLGIQIGVLLILMRLLFNHLQVQITTG